VTLAISTCPQVLATTPETPRPIIRAHPSPASRAIHSAPIARSPRGNRRTPASARRASCALFLPLAVGAQYRLIWARAAR